MSFTCQCLVEMCSVLWLYKLNFSLFDGDVPCPSAVVTRIIEEICCMHFSNKL